MRFFKGIVVAALAAFFMACGGNPADKMMGHMDKLVSLIEANKGDLDKAAKEVEAFFAANKDAMQADVKAAMEWGMEQQAKFKDDPEGAKKFMEDMEKRGEGLKKRMEALEKEVPGIKEHEGLKKAMEGMGSMMMGM